MKAVSALLPRQWRAGVLLAVRPWRQLQPLHKQYIGLTFTSRTMLVQAPPLTASMHSQVAPPPPPLLPAAVQSMVKDLREDIEFALVRAPRGASVQHNTGCRPHPCPSPQEEADGSTIAESAQHAYLEMDPVARDEPGAFTLRYQVFAYHRLQGTKAWLLLIAATYCCATPC